MSFVRERVERFQPLNTWRQGEKLNSPLLFECLSLSIRNFNTSKIEAS